MSGWQLTRIRLRKKVLRTILAGNEKQTEEGQREAVAAHRDD